MFVGVTPNGYGVGVGVGVGLAVGVGVGLGVGVGVAVAVDDAPELGVAEADEDADAVGVVDTLGVLLLPPPPHATRDAPKKSAVSSTDACRFGGVSNVDLIYSFSTDIPWTSTRSKVGRAHILAMWRRGGAPTRGSAPSCTSCGV
jgi:hypothetical protein